MTRPGNLKKARWTPNPSRLAARRRARTSARSSDENVSRGKRLGRQPGQRPKSDRLASKVMTLVAIGRSYRLIGREVGLSKNTVAE